MKKVLLVIAALMGAFVLFLFIYIRSLDMSYIRDKVKVQIENNINGQVSIGDLSISGLKSLVLENLVISQNGNKTIVLDSLSFDLTLADLIKSKLSFSSVALSGLQVYLRKSDNHYNLESLVKIKKNTKQSKKKTLSMVASTPLSPLSVDLIRLNSAKIYLENIHLLELEAKGNLLEGKLNFSLVKLFKDNSYINSKLFIDLNSKSGVLQLQDNLVDLVQIASYSKLEQYIPKGKASVTGDVKFNQQEISPNLIVKVDQLNLNNNDKKFSFKPIEVLIQSDKVYSNISGTTLGGLIACNLDLRKSGNTFVFKDTNFNLDLLFDSLDGSNSGNLMVRASINGPLENPNIQSKLNGEKLSVKGVAEVFKLSGVANGTLARFKLDQLNLIGDKGSKFSVSASLTDQFKTGVGLISGSLANLSLAHPQLRGRLDYNGEFKLSNGLLSDSLVQLSTKNVSFDQQKIPNLSSDLNFSTNSDSLVIKKSPILLANSDGQFILDARLPFNGKVQDVLLQLKGKSLVLRDLPYLLLPLDIKEIYISNSSDKLSINKLLGQVAGGQFAVSGLVDSSQSLDQMFDGNIHLKSLNLTKVSNQLPNLVIQSFTLDPNKKFHLDLQTKSQHFISDGTLSSDYKKILLSNSSKGAIDLSVFDSTVKNLGHAGISGIITLNTSADLKSNLLLAAITGKSLSLPVSKDFPLLQIASLESQATFNPFSNQLGLLNYVVDAFGGTARGTGTILLDSDKESNISCQLSNLDLDAFLTWVSKELGGHFYSKISGQIPMFYFNPKTADINDMSFRSNLSLSQVKYIYHQSVLDSIKGVEDSLGPESLKKFIKKKRTGFEERDHHNIEFKDVSSLQISMKKSNVQILPFQLIQKDDDYNFSPNVPINMALAPDKIKSKINGQLAYSFSNKFLKEKFPFLKENYTSNLDGAVQLNGELGLPVSVQEQSRVQKDVAGKLAMAIDLGFVGKQIEDGVRKLKDSQAIKDKIKDVKENFIDSIKSGSGKDLLKGLFGSKNSKEESNQEVEDKKEEFKNLLRGLF